MLVGLNLVRDLAGVTKKQRKDIRKIWGGGMLEKSQRPEDWMASVGCKGESQTVGVPLDSGLHLAGKRKPLQEETRCGNQHSSDQPSGSATQFAGLHGGETM